MKNCLIDIVMATYNQEKYIGKAIESVLFQKTDVSYKIVIGDDCSTDGTLEICKRYAQKYPEKITLVENAVNLGLIRNYLNCFKNCTGKYIAILEGDDYWLDPLKLQKQFEILENNEDIGLVHTNYNMLNDQNNVISILSPKILERTLNFQGYVYSDILQQNFICSVTVMFRREILSEINFNPFVANNCNTIDLIIWLQCAINYKIAFLGDITAMYRVSPNSISNNTKFEKIEKFSETKYFIKAYFLNKHKSETINLLEIKRRHDVFLLYKAVAKKDFTNSIKYLKKFTIKGFLGCIKEWRAYN